MDISCDLYRGIVYIPTSYAIDSGFYYEADPIEIVPAEHTQNLRYAIQLAAERGNPPITRDEVSRRVATKTSAILKATGARSWHKFDKERTGLWNLVEKNGLYQIQVYRPTKPRGWSEDRDQRVTFPAGTSADDVIARLVEMIQERHRQEGISVI